MGLPLKCVGHGSHTPYFPPCIHSHAHPFHSPPVDKPLRIQIDGPLVSAEKLLPGISWHLDKVPTDYPQPAGPELDKLTYRVIYGRDAETAEDLVVRDEYLGWVREARPSGKIDYYRVTFDHLVPPDDVDPEVLQINYLLFSVDPTEYTGKKVLAVPRCCRNRKGTQDRARINEGVSYRDEEAEERVAAAAAAAKQ
ncbi:hypothetical protein ACRALDRAFT_2042660 [Sodiomyces alcalophilus JCM 7366]|uniref:uncharacterized protein n=1 Tax=Sodiomyces alcalophilus JCM 7366 TaxID=591952 RepID=UPI0039B50C39